MTVEDLERSLVAFERENVGYSLIAGGTETARTVIRGSEGIDVMVPLIPPTTNAVKRLQESFSCSLTW
jgi:hypothetical protein